MSKRMWRVDILIPIIFERLGATPLPLFTHTWAAKLVIVMAAKRWNVEQMFVWPGQIDTGVIGGLSVDINFRPRNSAITPYHVV